VLDKSRPPLDLRAGAWVLPWLAGLTALSYYGDYGGGRGVIGFGLAIPVVLVFSVAIYALAYALRLDPASVRRHVEESMRESEAEQAELGTAH
jgi:hypothetical protein